jgi:predicted  nucleic acid-binding Zn-ribbon protein
MKTEELTEIGLTEEQAQKVFALNGKDITAAKEATKNELQATIDDLNGQLNTTKEAIKKFDGVDLDSLNKQIQDLNTQIATQDKEYQQKLADRDFNTLLSETINAAGGRNSKAVSALLDIETLKGSKNQKEDIKTAIDALKKDNDYLFESKEPIKNPVLPTNEGGAGSGNSFTTDAEKVEAARKVMGLPPIKENKGE